MKNIITIISAMFCCLQANAQIPVEIRCKDYTEERPDYIIQIKQEHDSHYVTCKGDSLDSITYKGEITGPGNYSLTAIINKKGKNKAGPMSASVGFKVNGEENMILVALTYERSRLMILCQGYESKVHHGTIRIIRCYSSLKDKIEETTPGFSEEKNGWSIVVENKYDE